MALSLVSVGQKVTASAWNLIVAAANAIGSSSVIPTSVAVGSGSGSVGANGKVTFTGASSISVNGAFGAEDEYIIDIDIPTTSATTVPTLQLRLSGSNLTGSVYDQQHLSGASTTAAANALAAQTSWQPGLTGTIQRGRVSLTRPGTATPTIGMSLWYSTQATSTAQSVFTAGLQYRTATAVDGFTFTFTGGTATGTIRVFKANSN